MMKTSQISRCITRLPMLLYWIINILIRHIKAGICLLLPQKYWPIRKEL